MQEGKFMASGQIVTTEQMQSLEREALKQGVTNEDLMESAGLAVAQECWMAMGTMAVSYTHLTLPTICSV